jgi:alpha-L-fucosidase
MLKPVAGVLKADGISVFNDLAYGDKIKDSHIKIDNWKNNQVIIDLDNTKNVTGIGIYQNTGKVSISISTDEKEWQELEAVGVKNKEIGLTTFMAGAQLLGRQVRYLKLKVANVNVLPDLKVEVYAK